MSDLNISRRALALAATGAAVAVALPAAAQPRRMRGGGDWLSMILQHHQVLNRAFEDTKNARGARARAAAQMHLAAVTAAHAGAEETAIYPTMIMVGMAPDGQHAYQEQIEVKVALAELDAIPDKTSAAYDTKLESIRAAVAHHMREEEDQWYPELRRRASAEQNASMTMHYGMDYQRFL